MISLQILQQLFPKGRQDMLQAFASQADSVLADFGISNTTNRLQFFLAQIGHESGGLTVVEENLNYSAQRLTQVWPSRFPTLGSAQPFANNPQALANKVYANRMGNGTPDSGDGWNYRGRGYIQITGRDGYRNVGAAIGIDLVNNPDLAATPADALPVACGFWKWKSINAACDEGDFVKVTRLINGGTVGLADREAWLAKVRAVLKPASGTPPATSAPSTKDDIRRVQLALQSRGFPSLTADGIMGPKTSAAIDTFRRSNGLPPGSIDAALKQALNIS
ncbi:glycoside hydrolase family 19 protein [Inquilinus sp. OTU3971]|uniref:glycoside hydrolase family 19 protein n=1 Tax=Inquilinus sp. OTU3971 TaxID=3043855 RepID=UPI00313B7FC0